MLRCYFLAWYAPIGKAEPAGRDRQRPNGTQRPLGTGAAGNGQSALAGGYRPFAKVHGMAARIGAAPFRGDRTRVRADHGRRALRGCGERGRPKAARPEADWITRSSEQVVQFKASGFRWRPSGQDRDAQTASAHLTPFFFLRTCPKEPSETERGQLPSATGPAVRRCDRVSCTCGCILTHACAPNQPNAVLPSNSCGKLLNSHYISCQSGGGPCLA